MTRLLACFFLVVALASGAQDPVQWTLTFDAKSAAPGSKVLAKFTGTIDEKWHLYSLTTPKGGPNPTTVGLADNPVVASFRTFEPKPERQFDQGFQMDTETYEHEVVFLFEVELKKDAPAGPAEFTANTRYQCCSGTQCLPPKRKSATATLTIDPAAAAAAVNLPPGYSEFLKPGANGSAAASTSGTKPAPGTPAPPSQDLGFFLLTAFGFGLAAIFTPCVFPMIPFTVSYFLNRKQGSRSDAVSQAAIFCIGIIVLFTGLGLVTKAIAGPFGVQQLGSSPYVNGFITVVFIVFGLSLLGAYELTLPSGLLTKLNQASDRGGYVGTLIMGLTFSLTAFACIGPIVGPLLVASVQGNSLQPVLGMLCFASGLATPFFVLALFPSYLQRMPKSGGWLVTVKVVLGFVVLAAALKYFTSVDQVLQWGFMSRERFLAAWVVLFGLAGLYLLGILRLEVSGMKPVEHLGVARTLIGAAFLIFAISLVPGMFGGRLGDLDAYVPPPTNFTMAAGTGGAQTAVWMKDQYPEALAKARQENKLVLINFTGYACSNCHWMKANMFPRPEIAPLLKDYVLLDLFTDRDDEVNQRNQKFEETKFGTISAPFYAIVDPDEHVIATFPGLTHDPQEFANFLKSGSKDKQIASNL
jgi:thiol:disulfide interchange protein